MYPLQEPHLQQPLLPLQQPQQHHIQTQFYHQQHTDLILCLPPMSLVESLTKTNLLLVADMKSGIQSIQNELSSIPLENIRNEQLQNFGNLSDKIEALKKDFTELKDIVMKRSYQNFKIDPKILDQWNPSMLVIRRSPWTNMRLILNKVAADNIADLFPNDWAPKSCFSDIQEKHYKVLSEVMTEMFYQCGILQDYDVLAIQGYEQFLKALHHHMILGNVTPTPTRSLSHPHDIHVFLQNRTLFRIHARRRQH